MFGLFFHLCLISQAFPQNSGQCENGEEYCEITIQGNKAKCLESSCCHWNTEYGSGRCWSSINADICQDSCQHDSNSDEHEEVNDSPSDDSGQCENGEEYCEITIQGNKDKCLESSCCHWNTEDGSGRCWSDIGVDICQDSCQNDSNSDEHEDVYDSPSDDDSQSDGPGFNQNSGQCENGEEYCEITIQGNKAKCLESSCCHWNTEDGSGSCWSDINDDICQDPCWHYSNSDEHEDVNDSPSDDNSQSDGSGFIENSGKCENGEEYCEITIQGNKSKCLESSCCHWNIENGPGRCWSDIDDDVCQDSCQNDSSSDEHEDVYDSASDDDSCEDGEEYCEITIQGNKAKCLESSCCHWNTEYGSGRCWSSINDDICQDSCQHDSNSDEHEDVNDSSSDDSQSGAPVNKAIGIDMVDSGGSSESDKDVSGVNKTSSGGIGDNNTLIIVIVVLAVLLSTILVVIYRCKTKNNALLLDMRSTIELSNEGITNNKV